MAKGDASGHHRKSFAARHALTGTGLPGLRTCSSITTPHPTAQRDRPCPVSRHAPVSRLRPAGTAPFPHRREIPLGHLGAAENALPDLQLPCSRGTTDTKGIVVERPWAARDGFARVGIER